MKTHAISRSLILACLAAAAADCSGSGGTTPTAPTAPPAGSAFTGQATANDVTGDASRTSHIPTSPDLASGGVEVSAGTLRLFGTVAAGTLDMPTTCVVFDLDTDQNAATGAPAESGMVGADYQLQIQNNRYTLLRCPNDVCSLVQQGAATTMGQTLEARVSLGLLGGDDGRLNLKMKSVVLTSTGGNSGPLDFMPDIGAGAMRLQ